MSSAIKIKWLVYLHVSFWIFIIVIHQLIFNMFFPWQVSLLRGVLNITPLAILFYLNSYFINHLLEKKKWLLYIAVSVLVFTITIFARFLINKQFSDVEISGRLLTRDQRLFIGAVLSASSIYLVSLAYQLLLNRFENEQKNMAIINEQNQAQIQFLKAQINPHFLFNTLHNIYSLAVVRSDQTAPMVFKLSELLRYVIYEGQEAKVALQKEIDHIEKFIDLFQMKHEEPQDIAFKKAGDFSDIWIEPMILIPFVENCFKHCDFDTNPDAFVRIELAVLEDKLVFSTTNTTNEQDRQKDKTGGVGLENIRRRLKLKYGDAYRLEIKKEKGMFELRFELSF